ncbi:MAG: phage tail tape measure protein [Treponemataceae bacterium]
MAVTARELVFKIIGENDEFNKAVEESKKKFDDFEKKTKDANKIFGDVAKQATIATTAIAAMGVAAAKMAVDFNEGFARVETLIPGATERVKELQDNVLELSPAVGKSTQDLTDGLYGVISAYGDASDTTEKLAITAKTATAGMATTQEALNLLSAVTKGYGDTSAQAQQKVSDLAFVTLKLGQTSMSDMASSIQRVTALSKTLNITQEEMFAVFSSGTGVIGGASEVATQLAATYNELLKPGAELTKVFHELGVTSGTELIEKFGGLQGALQAINEVAERTNRPINTIFGSIEAGKLALYATGEGAQKFASDLEAMHNAAGAADQAFNAATSGGINSFGFQLQQAGLNAKAFAVKLGQELIPSLQGLLQPLFKGLEYLKNLDRQTIQAIASVGKVLLTITATTAGIFGLVRGFTTAKKAVDAVRSAFKLLDAAFATNHIGLIVVGITTAIVAIKELCTWFDKAKQKAHELRIEGEKAKQAHYEEIAHIREKIKAWAELNAIQEKNAKQQHEQQQLEQKILDTLNITPDENATANQRKSFQEMVLEAKEQIGKYIALEAEHKKAIDETTESIKKRQDEIKTHQEFLYSTGTGFSGDLEDNIKKLTEEDKELKRLNETLIAQKESYEKVTQAKLELQSISEKDFLASEQNVTTDPTEAGTGTGDKDPLAELIKEQSDRLKAIDDAHKRELEIIKNNENEKRITKGQADKQTKEAEEKHYGERKKLLETFIHERMQAGADYNQAVNAMLSIQQKTIQQETSKTYDDISRIATEKLDKELAKIKDKAAKTILEIESEAETKFKAGDFGDKNSSDAKRERLKFVINEYTERSKELQKEINELTAEDADLHEKKITALKKELDIMSDGLSLAKEALGEVADEIHETLAKVAKGVSEYGGLVTQTVGGMADIATSVISQKQQQIAQQNAEALAEIERNKNEVLMEMENEYLDWKEERQLEAMEREEQRRQEEYEKTINEHNRSLEELTAQFNQETNIEKAKNLEAQMEAERKAKAEETRKKKEADAEKKRQKEERAQEIEMLNTKAQAQWQFQVATIEAQNASAQSMASLARQSAQWEKAQSIITLTVQTAVETARATAAFATGNFVGGALHTTAAALAGAQIGVVSAAPLPSGTATPAPLPPAPRPIKFALGGIVYPSTGGTPVSLASGAPAVVGEAGVPEIILPVTQQNLEALFKAQGITNNNSNAMTIAPSYQITINTTENGNIADTVLDALRENDRDLLALVEGAKRNNYIGD